MSDGRSAEDWGDVYRARRREFKALTAKLAALLPDLLRLEQIDVASLESRTKKVESFVEKLVRKKGKYNNPIEDVTDLCGFRIITYYPEDVDRVVALLRREFAIDEVNSEDKTANLDPDRFGYSSVHLVASLESGRSSLPEWSTYADFKWEFQVRTAVQHAWAAVEHKLNYKVVAEVPRDLQRQLYRLSALFELADEQFSSLRTSIETLKADYQEKVSEGDLAIALDADSLSAYLGTARRVASALKVAADAGFNIRDPADVSDARLERDRRELLIALQMCGIATIQELDSLLARLIKSKKGRLKKLAEAFSEDDDPIVGSQDDALTWLVLSSKLRSQSWSNRYTRRRQPRPTSGCKRTGEPVCFVLCDLRKSAHRAGESAELAAFLSHPFIKAVSLPRNAPRLRGSTPFRRERRRNE